MATKNKVLIEVDAKDSTAPTLRALNNNLKRTADQGKKVDKQFRVIRGGMGQMGHQVQDIAVMLQSGQNPMIILGQQGSQIASLFGPQGAIVGAFLAVGAAIGTSLLPSLFKTSEALKEIKERTEGLVDEFDELNPVLKDIALRNAAVLMEDYKQQIQDAKEEIHAYRNSMKMVNAQFSGQTEKVAEVNAEIQKQEDIITVARSQMEDLARKIDGTTNETEKLIESLTAEADALGKTEAQVTRLSEAYLNATPANQAIIDQQLERIANYDALVEGIKAEQKALDEAAKETEKRNKEFQKGEERLADFFFKETEKKQKADQKRVEDEKQREQDLAYFIMDMEQKRADRKAQLDISALNQASNVAGSMADMIAQAKGKESAAYKAAFAVQQAMAIASTIISTETAAAAALAPPPIGLGPVAGLPYSGVIRALGYASAGIIAGQTLASFEGGGLTGPGARSGGMDGKGGRLAMVHPNEKITDLHKGESGSKVVNVNFTIQANDTEGFDALLRSRRGQIVNIINQAVNNRGRSSLT
jgi:hypothetical protein